MIKDSSGAEVGWDWQLGTFSAVNGGVVFGTFGQQYQTIEQLEAALGVRLSAESKEYLVDAKAANPYAAPRRTVTKLQFMSLFRPADLHKIYKTARGGAGIPEDLSIAVQIALDRVDRAEGNLVDLEAPETIQGLVDMEAAGLLQQNDANRIKKGLPWA